MSKTVKPTEYNYIERKRLTERMCLEYPFLKSSAAGRSCGGKEITALKLGDGEEYSLIAAAFHGSERITSVVLLMFIEELCRAISENGYICGMNAKRVLSGRGVIFIPCVNPDGCDINLLGASACGELKNAVERLCRGDYTCWNANLRGVDINHNFNADWEDLRKKEIKAGIYGPSPTRFGGYKPESEPETLTVTELCRTVKIRQALALHSQGEVIYWKYGDRNPPRAAKMAEIMATSSGYALDTPIGIADGGGFKDWFITEFNRPAFTAELGLGKNPLPAAAADEIYSRVKEMLMLFTVM